MGNYLTAALGYFIIFIAEGKERLEKMLGYFGKYQDTKYTDLVIADELHKPSMFYIYNNKN